MHEKILDFGIARLSSEGIFAILFICFLVAVLAGIVFVANWVTGLITSSFRELIQTLTSINTNLAALTAKGQELDSLSKIIYQTADTVVRLEKTVEKLYEMISKIVNKS